MVQLNYKIGVKYQWTDELAKDIRSMICDRFQMVVMDTSEEADKSKLYKEIQAFLDHFEMTFTEKNLEGIKLCKNAPMTEEMMRKEQENTKNKVMRGLQEKNFAKKTFN